MSALVPGMEVNYSCEQNKACFDFMMGGGWGGQLIINNQVMSGIAECSEGSQARFGVREGGLEGSSWVET